MFGAILKATNSSFQKGMTFCRSIYLKKVMKLAFIFEQPSYLRHFTLVGHQKCVKLNMMSAAAHSTKYKKLSMDDGLKSAFCKMHFPCIIKFSTQRFKIDLSSNHS